MTDDDFPPPKPEAKPETDFSDFDAGAATADDDFNAADFMSSDPVQEVEGEKLPFPLTGVDLLQPPGQVGRLAAWIDSQGRRPRARLAVAGALFAVGNAAGLRFTDDRDGVSTNLFAFCVAGSRTGKDAIDQAVQEIHRRIGLAAAQHGKIKSEQEIIRNLLRHQPALYVIDEIGIDLQKVKNAQQRGGAAYLEGTIGALMSAYGRANGFLPVSGDVKEDEKARMVKDIAGMQKKIDADGDETGYLQRNLERLMMALSRIDAGIEKPFLSLMGSTTPVTFNHLVDFHTATNGFIGRSLLFIEQDTAPRSRKRHVPPPLPLGLEMMLVTVAGCNDDTPDNGRIEFYGDKTKIPTTPDAMDMLDAVVDWMEDRAEDHKAITGLESLYLGAYEIVSKVSLILAIPEGKRTSDHVRWAFALVKRDVEEKSLLVASNDTDNADKNMAMAAKLYSLIGDDGETEGVLLNRMKSRKREDVLATLAMMVDRGKIRAEAQKPGKGKKPTTRYYRT